MEAGRGGGWLQHESRCEVRLHTAGRICDILQVGPILAHVSLTHPFIGNAVERDQWGTYQRRQQAQNKNLKHIWAQNVHVVVPFISDTLKSKSEESAATLCLFAG